MDFNDRFKAWCIENVSEKTSVPCQMKGRGITGKKNKLVKMVSWCSVELFWVQLEEQLGGALGK